MFGMSWKRIGLLGIGLVGMIGGAIVDEQDRRAGQQEQNQAAYQGGKDAMKEIYAIKNPKKERKQARREAKAKSS